MSRKMQAVKRKRQLKVWISEDVWLLLQRLAPQIYGRPYGSLSYVVEEALRQYLLPRAHTQTHTNPRGDVRQVFQQVVKKLKEILQTPIAPKEVPEKLLDLAIMETRGTDPRTIEKWKRAFEKASLIKFVGGVKPNRIVELIGAMAE